MNLSKLEVLVLIRKHRKITAVADLLGLSQPTVTFHMKSLEKETGVKLFQSYPNRIVLTEAGEALCHYAVKMLALQEESSRVLEEYKRGEWGSLRIGASHVPAAYLLPKMLGDLQLRHPHIHISLVVKTAPHIRSMLDMQEIDLGMISAGPLESETVSFEALCPDELVIACLPTHPLSRETNWTPERIAREDFLFHDRESTTRNMCEEWARRYGLALKCRFELGSAEAIKQAILSGVGISVLSRTAIDSEVKKGEIWCRPLPGEAPERHIYLGLNRNRLISPLIRQFIDFVKAYSSSIH